MNNPSGRLAGLIKKTNDHEVIIPLFLATVSRYPTEGEILTISKSFSSEQRGEGFRDLLWALLNSKEFTFNH